MNISCRVIEDLLPLYHDGVCSEESRRLVEKHVDECFECRTMLKRMENPVEVAHDAPDDEGAFRAMSEKFRRAGKKKALMGALIAIAAAAVLAFGWWAATELTVIPVPTEKIAINDLSVTEDGTVVFQLLIDDGRELRELRIMEDNETGTVYLTPRRAIVEQRRDGDRYMSLNGQYVFVHIADEEAGYRNHFTSMVLEEDVIRLCVGTEEDNIVIWEEGIELPAATEHVEALYDRGE